MDALTALFQRLRYEARLQASERRIERLRQITRLAAAERRAAALQQALGATLQQTRPAGPGNPAGASPAPMTGPIPEDCLQLIWQAIHTARRRPRRLIRLRIQPPLLSRRLSSPTPGPPRRQPAQRCGRGGRYVITSCRSGHLPGLPPPPLSPRCAGGAEAREGRPRP